MSNPVLAPDIWISVALSTHGCGSCWQMRHPVSRATQGSAAQRSRARGCSFLPSCLPCRWASDQRWNQSRTHAYPQPSSWFPCLHTEQIHQTQTVLILDLLIAVALSAHSHGNCWQMSHPIGIHSNVQPEQDACLSSAHLMVSMLPYRTNKSDTNSAGTRPIDCSGSFNTWPWKLLADEPPSE
ncbi:uncharacterized protein LOC100858183 isoform X2 [Gallus gallus]|uniref:uncharacterized protein LOC100858183 isoform X2 n=1 Tax=Gallus gallus TaxID=9031 RepID=UPI001AE362D8|nr:uncharacterized protein LOC100858183 isoform X2 [Gallus gallus]